MARPLFWLGIPTSTTAVVVVRSLTNGVVTVSCNGQTFTETADTSVTDGLVRITVTGLSPDGRYAYTVTCPNADTGSNTLKTFSENGPAKICYWSCSTQRRDAIWAMIREQDPDCIICIGDFSYFTTPVVYGDITAVSLDGGSVDPDEYHLAYRACHMLPYFRRLHEQIPWGHVPDDHQFDIDNTTEVDVTDAIADAMAEGTYSYLLGNAISPYSTSDTKPFYYSFECGDTEVFVLCAVIHGFDPTDASHMMRDAIGAGNGCYGRDGNTNQEDWLLSGLAGSTKRYKLILSPKMSLKSELSNPDAWNAYSTEMDRVLQAIHDSGVTGVMFGCGDYHSPSIHRSNNGVDGATYDHVAVTACSLRGKIDSSGVASVYSVYRFEHDWPTPDDYDGDPYYTGLHGWVETTPTAIRNSIINQRKSVLAWAETSPTSNAMTNSSITQKTSI